MRLKRFRLVLLAGVVISLEPHSPGLTASIVPTSDPVLSTQPVAQTPEPNRDRFSQPAPVPTPLPPEPTHPSLTSPASTPPASTPPASTPPASTSPPAPEAPTQPPIRFPVSKIELVGSTLFKSTDPEIRAITQKLEGQSVTLEDLRQAADAITQLYLNRGYITSRAVLTDQTITNGVVQIQVIEGALEEIQIEGTQRLKQSYIRNRILLGAKPPLSSDKLEEQLRLLKADPLFTNVEASLRPGKQLGKSILVVRVTEAPALSGLLGSDNYSPPSVGAVRLGGALSYRNLTGNGDELSASYYHTTADGANTYDFNYRIPINALNGTLDLHIAPNDNRIIDPAFKSLDIRGNSELYELSYRQPLFRNPRREFALSLGFAIQNGQTFLFQDIPFPFGIGPDPDGNSRTRVLKFGQDYVSRDAQGAWAIRSQFNFGLGIFNATENSAPIPDGRFFSWLGQFQRVQRLGDNQILIAQFDLQLTPDSLLPSQQFVIGGGQSLRGFRQNIRSGDNGFRFSLEDRLSVKRDEAGIPVLQLAPFIDFGTVWNKSDNPNRLPSQTFLAGAGLGLIWQPIRGLSVRLDYAAPFVNLRDRGNDAQDQAFYFSAYYQF